MLLIQFTNCWLILLSILTIVGAYTLAQTLPIKSPHNTFEFPLITPPNNPAGCNPDTQEQCFRFQTQVHNIDQQTPLKTKKLKTLNSEGSSSLKGVQHMLLKVAAPASSAQFLLEQDSNNPQQSPPRTKSLPPKEKSQIATNGRYNNISQVKRTSRILQASRDTPLQPKHGGYSIGHVPAILGLPPGFLLNKPLTKDPPKPPTIPKLAPVHLRIQNPQAVNINNDTESPKVQQNDQPDQQNQTIYSQIYNSPLSLPAFCIQPGIDKFCVKCSARAWNNNGICQPISGNCVSWNETNGDCMTCSLNSTLIDGNCIPTQSASCKQTLNSTCSSCWPGFQKFRGLCIIKLPNCLTLDENGTCIKCMESYSLVNDECKRTTSKVLNCASFDSLGKCKACNEGFKLSVNFCVTERCETVSIQGVCTSCKGEYKLVDGNCVIQYTPKRLSDVCLDINKDGTSCQRCKPGYLFDDTGRCIETDALCSKYYNGICTTCVDGAYLKNGACINSTEDFCSARAGGSQCVKCAEYALLSSEGDCLVPGKNCFSYNNKGQCLKCPPSYVLIYSKCMPTTIGMRDLCMVRVGSTCTKCVEAAILKQGACEIYDVNCLLTNQKGFCKTCQNGYQVIAGVCMELNKRYLFSYKEPNCMEWKDGICIVCSSSYDNISGKCVLRASNPLRMNCANYSQGNSKCTKCKTGFNLKNGKCQAS